jgi:zinc protease
MVQKHVLDNGFTILAARMPRVPKVSLQLWYNVGSKHEQSGEHGIAHFIEHMIFKGTSHLSESDINALTTKMSGVCNAFTSHDYTGYLFDVPSQYWVDVLPIMADCMSNCSFRQDFLDSELNTIIQELKMYNDDYLSTLVEKMTQSVFAGHPYQHPIIGYKNELFAMTRDNLLSFYNQHYTPDNAVLVVVGDIEAADVFAQAKDVFGSISSKKHENIELYYKPDLANTSTKVYRAVKNAYCLLGFVLPGIVHKKDYLYDALTMIIASGRGSRLYQKLAVDMDLVIDIDAMMDDMFDQAIFMIFYQPKRVEDIEKIEAIITQELFDIVKNGFNSAEIARVQKKILVDHISLYENPQKYAYMLGKLYTATRDEKYLDNYCTYDAEILARDLQQLVRDYLYIEGMHSGYVFPLSQEATIRWSALQSADDARDSKMLVSKTREAAVEPARAAEKFVLKDSKAFSFPRPEKYMLSNGLQIITHHTPDIDKIELILNCAAKQHHDPQGEQGITSFVYDMLEEGAGDLDAKAFSWKLESYGMSISILAGQIHMSMLSADFEVGLQLLVSVLVDARFDIQSIEQVRDRLIVDIEDFWDDHTQFSAQLLREAVYGKHPYGKPTMGVACDIERMTRKDLISAYRKCVIPQGAILSIVGNTSGYNIVSLLDSTLGTWQGQGVFPATFGEPLQQENKIIEYPINRDQMVLAFGGLSVRRLDPRYDSLLLFDQVFSGGVLGGMNSRLFQLREASGLFYGISGSLIAGAHKDPGMVYIKTLVSNDRLDEARVSIKDIIEQGANTLTQEELSESVRALKHAIVDNFATNRRIATTFLYAHDMGLADDYFDTRAHALSAYTLQEVQDTVNSFLHERPLVELHVGRV